MKYTGNNTLNRILNNIKNKIPKNISNLNNDLGYTKSSNVTTFVVCTTAQYNSSAKDSKTVYLLTD